MIGRLFLVLALLGGCASDDKIVWPSLAPRANEVSPLVPRVPLGACAGCDSGLAAAGMSAPGMSAPPAALGMPELPELPADVAGRLVAISSGIAALEGRLPEARAEGRAAVSRARDAEERMAEADVQASRFEALFLGLGELDAELIMLEQGLVVRPEMAALMAEAARLRARLDALEVLRVAGL